MSSSSSQAVARMSVGTQRGSWAAKPGSSATYGAKKAASAALRPAGSPACAPTSALICEVLGPDV